MLDSLRRVSVLALIVALLAACGGGSDESNDDTDPEGEPTEADGGGTDEGEGTDAGEETHGYAEFCTKQQALQREFIQLGAGLSYEELRERLAALLEIAPPELVPHLEAFAEYDFEGQGMAAAQADLEEASAALATWVADNCAPPNLPTFTLDHHEGTGLDTVYFVRGSCQLGGFPTDVHFEYGLVTENVAEVTDLGDGLYSVAVEIPDEDVDPISAEVLTELNMPGAIGGTCT